MTSPAVAAVDARVASRPADCSARAALVGMEAAVTRRLVAYLVDDDRLDAHCVRVIREVRARLAALPD